MRPWTLYSEFKTFFKDEISKSLLKKKIALTNERGNSGLVFNVLKQKQFHLLRKVKCPIALLFTALTTQQWRGLNLDFILTVAIYIWSTRSSLTTEQWFPAKMGILKFHHDRRYDYSGHGFHTLPVIKHLKVKFLSEWGP